MKNYTKDTKLLSPDRSGSRFFIGRNGWRERGIQKCGNFRYKLFQKKLKLRLLSTSQ